MVPTLHAQIFKLGFLIQQSQRSVVLDEPAYRKFLLDNGTPEAAINGTLSFAKELDSPFLREPSSAVKDLTGRSPTSVRALLLADKTKLVAARK